MTRMFLLSVPLLTFGVLSALPAQAEDTMMKKDTMHMSKPAHHMKKDAMMHKDFDEERYDDEGRHAEITRGAARPRSRPRGGDRGMSSGNPPPQGTGGACDAPGRPPWRREQRLLQR